MTVLHPAHNGLFLKMFNELRDGSDSPGRLADRVKVHRGLVTQPAVTRPKTLITLKHSHTHTGYWNSMTAAD